MLYRVKLEKNVERTIENLPGHVRQRIKRILFDLRFNPRPSFAEAMRDDLSGHYRIKFDQWRIVYSIDDDVLLVEVVKVGRKHGPEFYHTLN